MIENDTRDIFASDMYAAALFDRVKSDSTTLIVYIYIKIYCDTYRYFLEVLKIEKVV